MARPLLEARRLVEPAVGELQHDLRGLEVAQHREQVAVVAHGAEGPPVEIAEADVHGDLRAHAGHRLVDPARHVVHGAGVHAVVRLVDLDEVGPGRHQRLALGIDDGDEIGEQRGLVLVAAAQLERHHQRVRAGHRRLQRPARQRARQLELVHDSQPLGGRELFHDLERRVGVPQRLAEPPRRRQRADAGETVVETDDEPHAAHLAGGQHVHAGALLVEQRGLGGVLHQLAHVEDAEAPGLHRLAREPHPARQAVAADDRGGEQRGHSRTGVNSVV